MVLFARNSDLEQKLFGNLFPWFPNGESLDNMIQISSSGYFPNAGTYIYGTKEGNCPAEGLPLNVNQYGTLVIFAGNGDGGYGYGFALYATTHEDNPFLSVYTRQSGWEKIITDNNFEYGAVTCEYSSKYYLSASVQCKPGVKLGLITPKAPIAKSDIQYTADFSSDSQYIIRVFSQSGIFTPDDTIDVFYLVLH